eukprot:6152591-Amphidinium_carterae.1
MALHVSLQNVCGHLGMRLWLHVPPPELVPLPACDVSVLCDGNVSTSKGSVGSEVHVTIRAHDLPLCLPAVGMDQQAVSVINKCTLPKCAQRTNLPQNAAAPTCGLVIGAFTTRGR